MYPLKRVIEFLKVGKFMNLFPRTSSETIKRVRRECGGRIGRPPRQRRRDCEDDCVAGLSWKVNLI